MGLREKKLLIPELRIIKKFLDTFKNKEIQGRYRFGVRKI